MCTPVLLRQTSFTEVEFGFGNPQPRLHFGYSFSEVDVLAGSNLNLWPRGRIINIFFLRPAPPPTDINTYIILFSRAV